MHILFLVQAIELQLQLSNSQLHHALEDRTWQCSQLELQLNTLREQIAEQSERVQAAKAIEDVQTREPWKDKNVGHPKVNITKKSSFL